MAHHYDEGFTKNLWEGDYQESIWLRRMKEEKKKVVKEFLNGAGIAEPVKAKKPVSAIQQQLQSDIDKLSPSSPDYVDALGKALEDYKRRKNAVERLTRLFSALPNTGSLAYPGLTSSQTDNLWKDICETIDKFVARN